MPEKDPVIVIGAGVAGLTAADTLAAAGCSVVLLEGRDRIGGRVWSLGRGPGASPIEFGPEFIHGDKVDTWPILRHAGLATHEVPTRRWLAEDGQLREDDSLDNQMESMTARIDRLGADLSCADFLEAHVTGEMRWLLREYIEGFHAADPAKMSVQAFARSEQVARSAGDRQFRIVAGYGALIDYLDSRLRAAGVRIHFNTIAKGVCWSPGSVCIETRTDGVEGEFIGRKLIVTVPLPMLKGVGAAALAFEPELPGKASALAGLEMGSVSKLVFECSAPLWPVEKGGFIHSRDPWLPTWWIDETGLILTGWAGGPRAEKMRGWDERRLRSEAVRALSQIIRIAPAKVSAALGPLHWHDWTNDPFSAGAYSYVGVGALDAPQRLGMPVAKTIYLAGEATARPGQLGTVHGAIQSGRRAARALLRKPRASR